MSVKNLFKPDFPQYTFKDFKTKCCIYGSIKIYSDTSFLIVIKIYFFFFIKSQRVKYPVSKVLNNKIKP